MSLGTDLYNAYKSQRLAHEGTASIWDPIKRNKLKLCSTSNKKVKIKIVQLPIIKTATGMLFGTIGSQTISYDSKI